jgi:hypothetical protein
VCVCAFVTSTTARAVREKESALHDRIAVVGGPHRSHLAMVEHRVPKLVSE